VSAQHRTPSVVLRLVTATPGERTAPRTSPALDAALAAARDALSAAMLSGGHSTERVTRTVALLGRALRTRDRADVLTLASALAALAVEGIDDAYGLAGDPSGAWSDRADGASRLARAAAVLLASLPRGAS